MKINSTRCGLLRLALAVILLVAPVAAWAQRAVTGEKARTAPTWVRDGVIYEIYPRAFSATGDFNGITAQLDQLKDLGVNILWLMPIHPIGEKLKKGSLGSPYAVRDYYAINPEFGTTNDFSRLVKEAHARGLRLVLDVVANHTAWDNVMIAAHPEFYKQDAKGKIIPPVPEWTDVAGLNYANPQLREYMIAMLKYWLAEYDVDGFRCDVAHMVPVDFWNQARAELEQTKPDILMLAEASKPELLVKAFDIDYAWPFHATLNKVLLEGAPASDLRRSWEESRRQFPQGSLHLRISDNHDEARAVARFSIRGALAAEVLMLTLDGVPLLYNGMEAGDATESGDPALFEKMPVFWSSKERPPLRKIYRDLIKLRKQQAAFRDNDVEWLQNSNAKDVVSFLRRGAQEEFVVVINFSNRPLQTRINVNAAKEFRPVKISGMPEVSETDLEKLTLNGFECRIYDRTVPR